MSDPTSVLHRHPKTPLRVRSNVDPVDRVAHREAKGECVYVCRGDEGVMYVGVSGKLVARLWAHKSKTPWWPLVTSVEVREWGDGWDDAQADEVALIAHLSPTRNVHSGGGGRRNWNATAAPYRRQR